MSFALRLASDLVQVDAGATVPLGVEASNRDDEADTYEIQIEGLDPEWTAVPVPSFTVDGHDIHTEKIFLKPPRVTESLAGTYPFVITLRSLNSGETRSAQGVLEIRPFHHVSVDVSPKKASISPFSKECTFDVTVMNLGNSEHTLQLFASDPDDECAFDFDGADTVAADVQHVIDAAGDPVIAVFIAAATVAGEVCAGIGAEVGFEEALVVAVDGAHLAGP